jgi:hypothetical protein
MHINLSALGRTINSFPMSTATDNMIIFNLLNHDITAEKAAVSSAQRFL